MLEGGKEGGKGEEGRKWGCWQGRSQGGKGEVEKGGGKG